MKPSGKGRVRGAQAGSSHMGVLGLKVPKLGALGLRSLVLEDWALKFVPEGPQSWGQLLGVSGPSAGDYGLSL